MNEITIGQASKLTSPNPLVLVCTRKPDGSTNLAAVSWWTYLTFKPGMLAFAMGQRSYSGERIRETGKVVLAVPGRELAEAVLKCGSSTGRITDKVKEFGMELVSPREDPEGDAKESTEDAEENRICIPAHTRVAFACTLEKYEPVGDHNLYICRVDHVYAEESEEALFAWEGYSVVAPAKRTGM